MKLITRDAVRVLKQAIAVMDTAMTRPQQNVCGRVALVSASDQNITLSYLVRPCHTLAANGSLAWKRGGLNDPSPPVTPREDGKCTCISGVFYNVQRIANSTDPNPSDSVVSSITDGVKFDGAIPEMEVTFDCSASAASSKNGRPRYLGDNDADEAIALPYNRMPTA
jgi:hypothetical protein